MTSEIPPARSVREFVKLVSPRSFSSERSARILSEACRAERFAKLEGHQFWFVEDPRGGSRVVPVLMLCDELEHEPEFDQVFVTSCETLSLLGLLD